MHPHPASGHEQARIASKRMRAVALIALAAVALAGAFAPEEPSYDGRTGLVFGAAAHAAEMPRDNQAQERKPAARKKSRASRDTPFGREGDPRKATRVIRIEMSDAMRYFPNQVSVKKGQTVRFNVRNAGDLPHEMVLGTMDDLKKYAEMMKKHGAMAHDDPNVAHVEPGQTGRIVWQFTRTGEFYFGCLVPGHFEAGMIGTIVVR
jgi:uncharacterized cupredoxin-like copper-binding protein